uniref:Uncharacterized protein n=1 Tax=Avena sativa TaxID=4498 RepID=A0ACD5XXQ7_AVESA
MPTFMSSFLFPGKKMSSTSSRFESCGEMKSQNSSLQLGAQEGDEYSGSLCLDFGFKTQDVMAAAELLDDAERQEVEDLGFSTFLNLQLGTICERKETNLCMKLVDLEENRIRVQLQKDVIGYITPEEISHLLMLPRGDKAPLKYNKQQQKDFAKLRAELGGIQKCRWKLQIYWP